MTPGSFDVSTAREMVGDDRARELEAKASAAADSGVSFFQSYFGAGIALSPDGGYQHRMRASFEQIVFKTAHEKRAARIQRMAERSAQPA